MSLLAEYSLRMRTRRFLLPAVLACMAGAALAQETQPAEHIDLADAYKTARTWIEQPAASEVERAFDGVIEIEFRRYERPRPIELWLTRVDLRRDGVELVLTPPAEFTGDDAEFETRCANTLEFARDTGAQLAINTSAFGPFRPEQGMPMDIVGLAAVNGRRFSPAQAKYGAMYISRQRAVTLSGPPLPTDELWNVVPGFRMLIDDGRLAVRADVAASNFGGINPRTAVGVNRAGDTLWIAIVDGRQPQRSMGMTLVELAALFASVDCWDALNLDGGGSTTFVLQTADGTHAVWNTPVGQKTPGSLRQVANNLGLRLPGVGPAARRPASAGAKP